VLCYDASDKTRSVSEAERTSVKRLRELLANLDAYFTSFPAL
jgi:hypothetical protein